MRTEDFPTVVKEFSLDGPSNVPQEGIKVEWSKGLFLELVGHEELYWLMWIGIPIDMN